MTSASTIENVLGLQRWQIPLEHPDSGPEYYLPLVFNSNLRPNRGR